MAYLGAPSSTRNEIEVLFNKIMSPIKKEIDPNLVSQFCQKLNNDSDNLQAAIDLVVTKMQSSQEWEAMIALRVLEACVKYCGEPMHELIGRFRFLNEVIKLISPKYYGSRTSDKVKTKCIELMYCWSKGLPQKTKIKEAYEMLKKQSLITDDPTYVEDLETTVRPKPRSSVIEDDEKSKQLARLLRSKNPQDLELANRLIKNMVKQDEIKSEKISTRINELEQMNNNMKLLNEMLIQLNRTEPSESEKETIKYLHEELEKMRPKLLSLASETEDNDDAINEILKASDFCDKVMKQYEEIFVRGVRADDSLVNLNLPAEAVINSDFRLLKNSPNSAHEQSILADFAVNEVPKSNDPLKDLHDLFATQTPLANTNHSAKQSRDLLLDFFAASPPGKVDLLTPMAPIQLESETKKKNNSLLPETKKTNQKPKAFDDLGELSKALMEKSLNQKIDSPQSKSTPLNDLIAKPKIDTDELSGIFVPLESIKPAVSIPPMELSNKNNVKVVMHFARDSPAPDVHVAVISVTSNDLTNELKNFLFQAAVTKNMKIKLQPASRSDLPAYNPILPVSAITQVILIANPNQEQVRLKFKLSYSLGEKFFGENEQVVSLPRLSSDLL